MDMDKKLAFVHKQTKLALEHVQHFDTGGTTLGGPVTAGTNNAVGPAGILGAVGSVLGTNNNFQATGANIQQGTNAAQLNNAYTGAQGALGQATNQSNVLNNGLNQGVNSQNTLTNELTQESQGKGAAQQAAQSALNQNTGQNIAQQAALAALTRGAGANAGLIAQNAANTGAATQQTAVGQEATNQANNALAAQSQLGNLASTQVNQGTASTQLANQTQQGEQGILQNANTAANNAAVSQQSNINTTNAAVAAGNQNSNMNLLSGAGQAISSLGGGVAALFAKGGKVPEHLAHTAAIYHPHFAGGGMAWQNPQVDTGNINSGPAVNLPQFVPAFSKSPNPSKPSADPMPNMNSPSMQLNTSALPPVQELSPAAQDQASIGMMARGGKAKHFDQGGQTQNSTDSSPPEPNMQAAQEMQKGATERGTTLSQGWQNLKSGLGYKEGGKVPGKPKVAHDAYSNDTVKADLTPGEVVIDLNTLKDKGKLGQMARFVAKEIERKKAGRKLA
jgi:hypothetical protein